MRRVWQGYPGGACLGDGTAWERSPRRPFGACHAGVLVGRAVSDRNPVIDGRSRVLRQRRALARLSLLIGKSYEGKRIQRLKSARGRGARFTKSPGVPQMNGPFSFQVSVIPIRPPIFLDNLK